jgi:hypothetical protein
MMGSEDRNPCRVARNARVRSQRLWARPGCSCLFGRRHSSPGWGVVAFDRSLEERRTRALANRHARALVALLAKA